MRCGTPISVTPEPLPALPEDKTQEELPVNEQEQKKTSKPDSPELPERMVRLLIGPILNMGYLTLVDVDRGPTKYFGQFEV